MKINNIAHLAFRVRDLDKSLYFYCDCLGLKQKFDITYESFLEMVSKMAVGSKMSPEKAQKLISAYLKRRGVKPDQRWIVYVEVQQGQFIELFNKEGRFIRRNFGVGRANHIGYQHLSLEVDDIHKAETELIAKGVRIKTKPNLGLDNTWQMWIEDPDGNAIELMEYTDESYQVKGN